VWLWLALVCASSLGETRATPLLGWNFDWDDNIMFMKTPIVLFKKGTKEEKLVSTGEFAEVRQNLGVAGSEWADYETRGGDGESFRYFADSRGKNHFLDDVLDAMKQDPEKWQGPSWKAFVEACSRQETARQVTIITARGHSPAKMYAALKKLREMGILKFLPPQKNLILVGNPKFGGNSADPSARKAFYMKQFLDAIQKKPVLGDFEVVDSDGTGKRLQHLWGFSDDDYGNFEKAVKELGAAIKEKPGRWSNIKITLFYTGTKKEGVKPHAVVLDSKGEPRRLLPAEIGEAARILGKKDCDPYYQWLKEAA
jgi:hypothetical protein